MKSSITLQHLHKRLNKMNQYNKMTPFPYYDSDYVKDVEKKIKEITKSNIDYDDEPVYACKHCKSLHITLEVDEETGTEHDLCNNCFTSDEAIVFDNISRYLEYLKDNGFSLE